MKKLMVLFVAAFMAVSFAGTAMAANNTVTLSNANTLQFFASPVTDGGVSVYLLAGGGLSGASLIAVNPATGTSSVLVPSASGVFRTGSSAFGTPAVLSGETIFVQVYNGGPGGANATTGTSVAAINGTTGTTYYTVNIPQTAGLAALDDAIPGVTGYAAPLTIDPAGTTIYGVSGVSAAGTGASIWRIRVANGALSTFASGVSSIWAAPLVSGNSLYILGSSNAGGVSLIAFNKETGVRAARANVNGPSQVTPFATPAISGNSIFVVDATGGLTAYNKTTLTAGLNDFIQYATANNTAVTASPVTNGSFLAVTANDTGLGQAGITVFNLSRPLGGATGTSWFFTYTGATITATPAISNGILYVAVNRTSQGGQIDRFNLSGHSGKVTAPDFTSITSDSRGRTLGFFDYSSPIIKNGLLLVESNGGTGLGAAAAINTPVLYVFDLNAGGTASWPQFKFDAERTGNNTFTPAPAPVPGEEGGCFISTIK